MLGTATAWRRSEWYRDGILAWLDLVFCAWFAQRPGTPHAVTPLSVGLRGTPPHTFHLVAAGDIPMVVARVRDILERAA